MMPVYEMADKSLLSISRATGGIVASLAESAKRERDRRRADGENVVVLWDTDRAVFYVGAPLNKEEAP